MLFIIWFLLSCTLFVQSEGEYFSDVDKLSEMGYLEEDLVRIFNSSIHVIQLEHESYYGFFERVRAEHALAKVNVEKYLSNPINAFTLIKRMAHDWVYLKQNLQNLQGQLELQENMKNLRNGFGLPTQEDIAGAVRGILRVQRYYDLKPEDLAEGIINGTDYGEPLDWDVCYEIAKEIYDSRVFLSAKQWFLIALKKIQNSLEKEDKEEKYEIEEYKMHVHEYLALINYEIGLNAEALIHIDAILNVYPEHPVKQTKYYMMLNSISDFVEDEKNTISELSVKHYSLCKGIQEPDPEHNKLLCKLTTKNNPYFILAPLQMEILKSDPEIVIYHRVLTDQQIDDILNEAAELEYFRSEVIADGDNNIVSELRVSQQTWLDYVSPIMINVQKTLAFITGFNLSNSELMQVVSYGIGGQYDPHHDYFHAKYDDVTMPEGDRIATNMFYFSDVEHGGYTVFPEINVYSRPIKGALIVWHNLLRSLDGDTRTLHAGCPVLKGVKRIGNIWVRTGYQDVNRPCGLDEKSAFIGF